MNLDLYLFCFELLLIQEFSYMVILDHNGELRSPVGKVSDCISRGRELDPGSDTCFLDREKSFFMALLLPSADSRRVVVSYK